MFVCTQTDKYCYGWRKLKSRERKRELRGRKVKRRKISVKVTVNCECWTLLPPPVRHWPRRIDCLLNAVELRAKVIIVLTLELHCQYLTSSFFSFFSLLFSLSLSLLRTSNPGGSDADSKDASATLNPFDLCVDELVDLGEFGLNDKNSIGELKQQLLTHGRKNCSFPLLSLLLSSPSPLSSPTPSINHRAVALLNHISDLQQLRVSALSEHKVPSRIFKIDSWMLKDCNNSPFTSTENMREKCLHSPTNKCRQAQAWRLRIGGAIALSRKISR